MTDVHKAASDKAKQLLDQYCIELSKKDEKEILQLAGMYSTKRGSIIEKIKSSKYSKIKRSDSGE